MLLVVLIFLLVFTFIFAFVMVSSVVGFLMGRVPYVRTRQADILELVRKVPVRESDIFFDLGCGDGKVLFAVEKVSGAKTKGFEITLWTHLWSRVKKFFLKTKTELFLGNFFKNDLSEATVIYCYLFPPLMLMVGEKVKTECAPGTKVVSRDFPIGNLRQISSWRSATGHTLYLYQV